jgi:hypothetical protein
MSVFSEVPRPDVAPMDLTNRFDVKDPARGGPVTQWRITGTGGERVPIRHATADLLTRLQASPAVARRPAARSQTASPVPMQPGSL